MRVIELVYSSYPKKDTKQCFQEVSWMICYIYFQMSHFSIYDLGFL